MSEEVMSTGIEGGVEASMGDVSPEAIESSVPEGFTEESGSGGHVIEGSSEAVQENIETLAEQVEEAIEQGATKKEVQNLIKEFELKVNGKQVKAKIDLGDEEAVKRELQKAYAFNDVSQENAAIKKALNARIQEWKSDPTKLFLALELDPTEFAANHLDRLIEEEKKSPEQKELEARMRRERELEDRVREFEEREKRLREAIEAQEKAKRQEVLRQTLIQEIDEAISQSKVLKPSIELSQEMADLMHYYQDMYPNEEITAQMVLPKLEKLVRNRTKNNVSALDDDGILELLGKDRVAQLAKKLRQITQPVETKKAPVLPSQTKVPSALPQAKPKEEVKKRTLEEAMRAR